MAHLLLLSKRVSKPLMDSIEPVSRSLITWCRSGCCGVGCCTRVQRPSLVVPTNVRPTVCTVLVYRYVLRLSCRDYHSHSITRSHDHTTLLRMVADGGRNSYRCRESREAHAHIQYSNMLITFGSIAFPAICAVCLFSAGSNSFDHVPNTIGRRRAFSEALKIGGRAAAAAATLATDIGSPSIARADQSSKTPLADRLDATTLKLPPPSMGSELNGVDNFYYPKWLAGEWDAIQTLRGAGTPLGLKFVGGPGGSEAIAAKSMEEQRKQIDVPVKLKLRWIDTKFGVAEDRLFNTRSRLDSFAGRSVVASVEYANVGGSNRASVIALGGSEQDPLQTTVTRFRGPAAQKVFVVAHGEEYNPDDRNHWAGREVLRSIFALTNQNTAPPVTTDTENIWQFERIDDDNVKARLRIASYLNAQSDSLYFDAKNRAVSFADYDLVLKKSKKSED